MIYKKLNKRYAVLSYLLVVCTLISSFSLPIFAQEVGEIVEEEPLGSIDMGTMPGSGEADPLAYPPPPV